MPKVFVMKVEDSSGNLVGYVPDWGCLNRVYTQHPEHGVVSVPKRSFKEPLVYTFDYDPPAWTVSCPEDTVPNDWAEEGLERWVLMEEDTLEPVGQPWNTYADAETARAEMISEEPEYADTLRIWDNINNEFVA